MADFVNYIYFTLIFIVVILDITILAQPAEIHPASDFSRHTFIKPRIYHGREKRQITTTKDEENDGNHVNHLTITIPTAEEDFILDLTINKQLIPKGFFRKTQLNGKHKLVKPSAKEIELCHYNGKVRGKSNSWVALSTCNGLSGVFFDGHELHYIEKGTINNNDDLENNHFLYKHSHIIEQHNKTCGYHGNASDKSMKNENTVFRFKRSNQQHNELVRGPYNANKESKYVELVLVIDNREYKEFGENTNRVENHAKSIANIINALYSPLNIFIALVGVVIWTEHDEISFSPNGDTTLTNFLHYRREKLLKEHPNDNAQLLTKFSFESGVVGKALKGPICTYEFSGGVNTDHSSVVGLVATTVAHEMGHNFGMEHDTNECVCPDDRCIMAPSSSTIAPTHWSSCSLNYLLLAFTHGMDYCLKNKPQSLFGSSDCGNGFVEPGEQCDCGLPEHCDNTCCNATTCMLHRNASCATGECCDLTTCKPKNAGTICRTADYECDLPEYCTGQSEYCPNNIYKMDTELCDNGKAFCYQGFCRTRTDQCKLLWGETGKSSDDQCYQMNIKGTRHGNCGYNKFNQSFFKCTDDDVLCGMLHCKHLNERLEFGMESVSILSHTFINLKGSIVPCRTAIVDLGINQVDPGLAPDGAKCGNGKMCVNQKCLAVENLKKGHTCLNDCNGNGWCNSLGHCHCKEGYAPPYCEEPGPGGSEDSGPASDPNANKELIYAMFIIFLGIIPGFSILALLFYYMKHNGIKFGRPKSLPPTSKPPMMMKNRGPPQFDTTKRGEDNHSLLHEESTAASLQNEFFGHFKGFSLTPIPKKNDSEPIRTAPPPPPLAKVTNKTTTTTPSSNNNMQRSNTTVVTAKNFLNKSVSKAQSFKHNLTDAINVTCTTPSAPALPPPNPGSTAKPIISSPILENSTCTAKELISPLRNAPKIVPNRVAPDVPVVNKENKRPLSMAITIDKNTPQPPPPPPTTTTTTTVESNNSTSTMTNVNTHMSRTEELKKTGTNTLNRIASFLKNNNEKKNNTNSLSKTTNQQKNNKILNKNSLRTLQISDPIPQTEITLKTLPVDMMNNSIKLPEINKNVVMRAQSMRDGKIRNRPIIQTFGSMRQPIGFKRPMSIPSANRPKSPPPPRPPIENIQMNKIESLPGYQKPILSNTTSSSSLSPTKSIITTTTTKETKIQNQYDDCLNTTVPLAKINELSPTESDNIYAVIEETPITSPQSNKSINILNTKPTSSTSNDSMGLLSEIVSEIQNRNFDSIYSTSTLARKQKKSLENKNNKDDELKSLESDYVNTSSIYNKSPESVYSNMNCSTTNKSSASSTSSGYIHPSAVNVPIKTLESKITEKPTLSTFKDVCNSKPFSSTFTRSQGPLASTYNNNNNNKTNPPINLKLNNESKSTVKTPPSPTSKSTTMNKAINRQITPTNLRTRKASPTRPAPSPTKNRSITNSPDLVMSCNTKPSSKPPDVLGNNGGSITKKPLISSVKPNVNGLRKAPQKTVGNNGGGQIAKTSKSIQDTNNKKPNNKIMKTSSSDIVGINPSTKTNSTINMNSNNAKIATRSNSNVASLQQKFENKTNPIQKAKA